MPNHCNTKRFYTPQIFYLSFVFKICSEVKKININTYIPDVTTQQFLLQQYPISFPMCGIVKSQNNKQNEKALHIKVWRTTILQKSETKYILQMARMLTRNRFYFFSSILMSVWPHFKISESVVFEKLDGVSTHLLNPWRIHYHCWYYIVHIYLWKE